MAQRGFVNSLSLQGPFYGLAKNSRPCKGFTGLAYKLLKYLFRNQQRGLGSQRDSLWTLRKLPQPSTRHVELINSEIKRSQTAKYCAHKQRNKALTNSVRKGFPVVIAILLVGSTLLPAKGCTMYIVRLIKTVL